MKILLTLIALALAFPVQAWNCRYDRAIDLELDLSDSNLLTVLAGAGDLELKGRSGSRTAYISGTVCSSDEKWLEQADVAIEGGDEASIAVNLPDIESSWSLIGSDYVYIDLEITVPDDMPLTVWDSSGDIEMNGVGELSLKDSSGDIDIRHGRGSLEIKDSSGDIELFDIEGDVNILADSSGDIRGEDIGGDVRVHNDSSGSIDFEDVAGSFAVDKDSSGDIAADGVGGDFIVMRDSSGDIRPENVRGDISLPSR